MNICHHMLTSSRQLKNRSFHVVERTRTSSKCQKKKNARAKRAQMLFFVVKYANLRGFCCRRRRGCLSSLLLLRRNHVGMTKSRTSWTARQTKRVCHAAVVFIQYLEDLTVPFVDSMFDNERRNFFFCRKKRYFHYFEFHDLAN